MELSDYLKIGEVCEVQGRIVKAGIYSDKNTEHLNYNGAIIKNVGIGSFVLIRKGFSNIVGKVDGEYIKENIAGTNQYTHLGNSIRRIVNISILGSIEHERFIHGLTELPLIGNYVYILEEDVVSHIFSYNPSTAHIQLGRIIGHDNYPFELGVQEIACSHIGIFGNTGSGKSNTLAKLYSEIINRYSSSNRFKKNSKFIFIDFNGEYGSVFKFADKYVLTTRSKNTNEIDLRTGNIYRYPISAKEIQDTEFWSIILEATDKTQKPFISRTLRKYRQIQEQKEEFSIEKICELIVKTQKRYQDLKHTISDICDVLGIKNEFDNLDSYYSYNGLSGNFYIGKNYDISSLDIKSNVFPNITIDVSKLSELRPFELFEFALKYNYWIEISKNYITKEHIAPLIARADIRCIELEKVFNVLSESKYRNVLSKQSNIEVVSLLNVNLSMKKIIPMIICKTKYAEKKESKNGVLTSTLHLIIDEAHNILSEMSTRESEEWKDYRLESFEEIIKEGRKFGTFLTIASQRPSDISDTIISQLHNYFIHRLVNEEDLRKMYRSVSFADKASNEMIPILPAGGCLISGLATSFPVLVQIDILPFEYRPQSDNVEIDLAWGKLE